MAGTRIWVLNFDADDELAAPAGYTTPRTVRERFEHLATLVGPLLGPGDVVLRPDGTPPDGTTGPWTGRAFCPTPRAVRAWRRIGAIVPAVPPLEVLRAVNHRSFCADLGQILPGARWVTRTEELAEVVAAGSPTSRWLLKRAFGYAGRGRRSVRQGVLTRDDLAWVASSLGAGEGLQVEPWVERSLDVGLHGFIARSGAVTLGVPTLQWIDPTGAWRGTVPAPEGALAPGEHASLYTEAERTAQGLCNAGYFGPFGIDAFRWSDQCGATHFNPRCDVNARYSMGWAFGMGSRRPDLDDSE